MARNNTGAELAKLAFLLGAFMVAGFSGAIFALAVIYALGRRAR